MLEVPMSKRPGTMKMFSGKLIEVEGAVFKVETVDARSKKITLGIVAPEIVNAGKKEPTPPENLNKPALNKTVVEPGKFTDLSKANPEDIEVNTETAPPAEPTPAEELKTDE